MENYEIAAVRYFGIYAELDDLLDIHKTFIDGVLYADKNMISDNGKVHEVVKNYQLPVNCYSSDYEEIKTAFCDGYKWFQSNYGNQNTRTEFDEKVINEIYLGAGIYYKY